MSIRLAKEFVFGSNRLVLEANQVRAYLTAVSRNALSGAPIVLGPAELGREDWLELAEACRSVDGLLKQGNKSKWKSRREGEPDK